MTNLHLPQPSQSHKKYLALNVARRKPSASKLFLTLIIATIFATIQVSITRRGYGDYQLDFENALKVMVATLGITLLSYNFIFKRIHPNMPLILAMLYFFICLMISPFSNHFFYSAGTLYLYIGLLATILAASSTFTLSELTEIIKYTALALIFSSWAFYILDFEFAKLEYFILGSPQRGTRLSGVAGHAYPMAIVSASASLIAFISLMRRQKRLLSAIVFLIGLTTILATDTRGVLFSLIISCAAYYFLARDRLISLAIAATIFVLVFGALLFSPIDLFSLQRFSRSGTISELSTLAGRIPLWQEIMGLIAERPMFGYGFNESRSVLPATYISAGGWIAPHAHNFILQSLLNSGTVGTIFLCSAILLAFLNALRFRQNSIVAILVFVCINGLLSSSPLGLTPDFNTLLLFVSLVCSGRNSACGLRSRKATMIYGKEAELIVRQSTKRRL